MPRKTKDSENKDIELKNDNKEKVVKSTAKKVTAKKSTTKKASEEKNSKVEAKAKSKKTTTTKKSTTKKVSGEKDSKVKVKAKTTKNATTKKKTTKTKASTTKKSASSVKRPESVEYYDLPYRYNQTVVKILAQTPTNLFIYWDISDEDRDNYKKQYGENFFETTKPILKIYNDTLHYDFEIEINDFANSWYLHINDSKCNYRVELGRRPISVENENSIKENYIYISSSNEIESPNDKILFNTLDKMVYFKNTKTNDVSKKSFANLAFMQNMGKIYNIYDFYRELYKDEDIESFSNPSSGMF